MVNPSLSEADFFGVFDLPRDYGLDRDALEERYLKLAAAVHPDRVTGGSSTAKREAMERSAKVNEAYRVLRDPVKRAEYLVKLGGVDLDSSDPVHGAPKMEQAFLLEMIERREAVDEARAKGPAALEGYRGTVEDDLDSALDRAIAALGHDDIQAAAQALVARRYYARLIDEIDDDVAD